MLFFVIATAVIIVVIVTLVVAPVCSGRFPLAGVVAPYISPLYCLAVTIVSLILRLLVIITNLWSSFSIKNLLTSSWLMHNRVRMGS